MKKLLLISLLFISISSFAQQQPKADSMVLEIRIDTNTYKYITQLIRENINGNTVTGATILNNILTPLRNFRLVPNSPADKPKVSK